MKPPSRARILFLSCHLPFPAISGGRLRELELLRRLSRSSDIGLRVVSKTYEEDLANAQELVGICESVEVFAADATGRSEAAWEVVRHRSAALSSRLEQDLAEGGWDLVHVEGFYLMQHVPRQAKIPVVLAEQNIEYLLWKQKASGAGSRAERQRCIYQYLLTMKAEMGAWELADRCVTVTDHDKSVMLESHPHLQVSTVPDGCDHLITAEAANSGGDGHTITFIANFAYEPNLDAARFLCTEIMPRVRVELPDARLLLVGNAPPQDLHDLSSAVGGVVTGRVEDVYPYLRDAHVVVCPLRVGGGIKVKVLEALRAGKPLVTTSVGAQGLDLDGVAVVVDEASGFAAAIADLVRDDAMRTRLSRAAARYARELPTWNDAARTLEDCYRLVLARSQETIPIAEPKPMRVIDPRPGPVTGAITE